ncbi:hypothetical protein L6R50_08540 [Myxococcota bacterium]|nr:hypothetical protein [Myxococcota bacterium]
MPIPELTPDGLLPPGVHECTFAEVRERFGRFCLGHPGRHVLVERLRAFLAEARTTPAIAWLAVDGSFVTAEPDPGDIDLVLALRADHDFQSELRPFEYNLLSRRRVGTRYGFDVLVGAEGTPALARHMEYFQLTRDGRAKGILKVTP